MRWAALLVVCAFALAGCADSGNQNETEDGTLADAAGTGGGGEAPEPEPLPDPPTNWLMDDDETLHDGEPEEETSEEYPVQSFHHAFTGGFDFYMGSSGTYAQDLLITDAEFDITIRHDGPSTNAGPAIGIDAAYGIGINAENSNGVITLYGDGEYQAPGSTEAYTVDVGIQPGGLVLPQGEALFLGTASFYVNPDDFEGSVFLMNSPEHPSGVTVTTEWITLPGVQGAENLLTESGTFPERTPDQPGCGDQAQEGAGKISHTVTIPENAGEVSIEAVGANNADVDIFVQAGGETAAATYPASPEVLRLYAPNLESMGTGDWTMEVHNCGDGPLDYDLTVDVHRLVPVLESEVVPVEPESS